MINYIQHIALGVKDVDVTHRFYRDILGFRIKFFDAPKLDIPAIYMDRPEFEKDNLCEIRMLFIIHPLGGAALEIAYFNELTPISPPKETSPADIGFVELGVRVNRLEEFIDLLSEKGVQTLTPVQEKEWENGSGRKFAYIRDPDGNLIQLIESGAKCRHNGPCAMGIEHLGIGVRDIEVAEKFYTGTMHFGKALYSWKETTETPETGSSESISTRNVLIGNRKDISGQGGMINQTNLQLMYAEGGQRSDLSIDRRWGDLGILEMALDTSDIDSAISELQVSTQYSDINRFHIRLGIGSYGYYGFVRDPDGNLVEIVNLKKIGFMHPNMLSSAIYPVMRAMDRFRKVEMDLNPFFKVSI